MCRKQIRINIYGYYNITLSSRLTYNINKKKYNNLTYIILLWPRFRINSFLEITTDQIAVKLYILNLRTLFTVFYTVQIIIQRQRV